MSDSREGSPVSSILSSHDPDEFGEDVKMEDADGLLDSHPTKKRRTGQYSHQSTPVPMLQLPPEDYGDISSDTSGSIPNSPIEERLRMADDDPMTLEQVTICRWQECEAGDLGNMDNLVKHLGDDHDAGKESNFVCEWHGCQRKGQAHASGYALKVHMRSHTKEKPFYCALPECDRSFTRSDALAKHMRTVHETEALRPSDPIPRTYSSAHLKPQRLKLIMHSRPPNSDAGESGVGADNFDDDAILYTPTDPEIDPPPPYIHEYSAPQRTRKSLAATSKPIPTVNSKSSVLTATSSSSWPPDLVSDPSMPPDQQYKILRRHLHWAQEESNTLREQCADLEASHRREWMQKELILTNLMEAEVALAHTAGPAGVSGKILRGVLADLPRVPLPMAGKEKVWYREIPKDSTGGEARDREGQEKGRRGQDLVEEDVVDGEGHGRENGLDHELSDSRIQ